MTKALLFIWIGIAQTQTQSIAVMDSMGECMAARAAIIASGDAPSDGVHCIPYAY